MKSDGSKWLLYTLAVCFAVYWLSNLVLWYPWSVNETLGQVLMLTLNPLLWGFASYSCLVRYPGRPLLVGAVLNSAVFVIEAIAFDLLFFVAIRNALDKLLHVTTLYAWGFVLAVPFLVYFLGSKLLRQKKRLTTADFRQPLLIGLASLAVISGLLLFDVKFS